VDARGPILNTPSYPRPMALIRVFLAALLLTAAGGCGSAGGEEGAAPQGGESAVVGDADEGIAGVETIRVADNTHTQAPVEYQLRPPAGGAHHPVWWNCGFYDQAIPEEHAVHDLEHGVVWLAYSPNLAAADVEAIHDLVRDNPKVMASPYEGLELDEALVATAWARQLRLESVQDERLAQFVEQYQDGSQAPEPGARCTGGPLGDPSP
jgi:Protein of unknown function (DUF3105)